MSAKNLAIQIENISKYYPVGDVRALNDISFDIFNGDFVGVIGKNGCGKSTLLKIIAGIIKPTAGKVSVYGSMIALTDIGAGFHPDLTGRENIYMTGHLFSLNKKEINNIIPEILAFSELEKFIDTPVKSYSQGMFLRLAFSILVNIPIDIVLFDEVLAVGDASFQQKCFDKLRQMKDRGLTVIMVSHTFEEIASFCNVCIVLEKGVILSSGKPEEVYNIYMESLNILTSTEDESGFLVEKHIKIRNENYIKVLKITIENTDNPGEKIGFSDGLCVSIEWEKGTNEGSIYFNLTISDQMNRPVLSTANFYGTNIELVTPINNNNSGVFISKCFVPSNFLNHGVFHLSLYGTLFLAKGNYFSILDTVSPIKFAILNSNDIANNYYWMDSPAPLRTQFLWKELKLDKS